MDREKEMVETLLSMMDDHAALGDVQGATALAAALGWMAKAALMRANAIAARMGGLINEATDREDGAESCVKRALTELSKGKA